MILPSKSRIRLFVPFCCRNKGFIVMLFVFSLCVLFPSLTNAYEFETRTGQKVSIEEVKRPQDIDIDKSRRILANSFISEYSSYCTPNEIDSKLQFWNSEQGSPSVEEYYHDYFNDEFREFQRGHLHWIEAKMDGELVGWVTFEEEHIANEKSFYMNTLVVSPTAQKQGIGEKLVFSLKRLGVYPETDYIHLLMRKKNQGGRKFYTKLGFKFNPSYSRVERAFYSPDTAQYAFYDADVGKRNLFQITSSPHNPLGFL